MRLACLTPHAKERERGNGHYPLLLLQPASQDILCGNEGAEAGSNSLSDFISPTNGQGLREFASQNEGWRKEL